jgi:hypothetical protein
MVPPLVAAEADELPAPALLVLGLLVLELLVLELQAARTPGTVTSPAAVASPLRAARRLN